ncbi:MAG: glycosyltransferase [Gemmatimonadota bacterium]|nr:glycosyltransferase [Gemmatimonadota bacterium]
MRVLFVAHSFPRHADDVAGAFILRLAVALRARGVDVRVLAPAAAGLAATEAVAGVRVDRFRYAPRRWETLAYEGTMAEQVHGSWRSRLALAGLVLGGRRAIRRAVREFQPDVVHAHWWFPGGLSAALAGMKVPLVVTLHGSDVRLTAGSALAPALMRFVLGRSAAVTAVSSWLCAEANRLARAEVHTVAPMPVDDSPAAAAAARGRSVLFVGRLNAQKGVRDLIDAARLLPGDVAIDIVGEGNDRAALEARASEAGLARRVRWHGRLAPREVRRLYPAAGVVAIPSRDEGLGLVAVEAQLAAAPVVAYRSGGLTDLVEDGVSGLLAEPGNVPALAGAIRRVLDDPALANRIGAGGRGRALARFSPRAAAAAYEGVYRGVVA